MLGEAIGIIGDAERSKHSIHGVLGSSSCTSSPSISPALSPSPSPSPSSSTVTTPTSSSTENLRCPRCDSTNTKFCYYNNYNLTQPRHFCKTCRRYWTKGGALRNVPIGGGCRKNKTTTITPSAVLKSTAAGKFRAMATEIGKSGFMSNFDHEYPSSVSNVTSPILWTPPDQNSHMLSLLKANQNPNPNSGPMSSSLVVKEEASVLGSHGNSSHAPVLASGALNARILGLDASSAHSITSFGINTSSLWRDNNERQQHIGFILGETQGTGGAHDLYQRLRSSANYSPSPGGNEAIVLGNINVNVGSTSSSPLTILDSAPVAAADPLGCWNPILSWSDLPTTHGAYP